MGPPPRFVSLALAAAALLAAACGGAGAGDDAAATEGTEEAIGVRNMAANAFGLRDHELVLTLDDGPGPRTVELAEWLAHERIPAVFFMVGKHARANPDAVQRIVDLSNANDGLFIIGNHSMTHSATPLPRLGTDATIREIMDADAILDDAIAAAQRSSPTVVPFFRPPYGAFTALGAANIAKINEAGAAKYTGPVFWDIGGELAGGYSADWACWGQRVDVAQCAQGYITEASAKRRGIVLAHDVHARTVDMLTGSGAANGQSMLKELQARGFRFVSLRAHDEAVSSFGRGQDQLASNPEIAIDAQVLTHTPGRVTIDLRVSGGAKVMIALDGARPVTRTEHAFHLEQDVAPGEHYVTVTVLDASGVPVRQERYPFVAAAPIADGSEEAIADNCVALDHLKSGRSLRLYHSSVACGAPGAIRVDGVEPCFRYAGDLVASRDPVLTGAREWNLDFDLAYAADPRDRSRVSLVMDADSGSLESGRRYWPGSTRQDVSVTMATAQCDKGLFTGHFTYLDGSTEDLVIALPTR